MICFLSKRDNVSFVFQYIFDNSLEVFILTSSIFFGTFVRIQNLAYGQFLFTDEFRTINWDLRAPLLNIAYKIPLLVLGNYQDTVLYTTAFYGILSILIIFVIGKVLFNGKVGSYSALILSFFAIHVRYSRTGFGCILSSLLLLLAFLLFLVYIKNRKYKYLIFNGIFLCLAFLAYVPSFAAIATFFILLPIILKLQGLPFRKIFVSIVVLGISSLIVIILLEIFCSVTNKTSFLYKLHSYKHGAEIHAKGVIGKFNLFAPFASLKIILVDGGKIQFWLLITGLIYCICKVVSKKNHDLFLLLGFICFSYFILAIMCFFGFYTIYPRRYIYLIPFLCIAAAYLLYNIEIVTNKYLVIVFLVIFSFFSFPKCILISKDTFKIKPITDWLERHKISKNKVITNLDLCGRRDILQSIEHSCYPNNRYGYYRRYSKHRIIINWKKVNKLFSKKGMRYILTSGTGVRSIIGYNDPVLKKNKPIKFWIHPFNTEAVWRWLVTKNLDSKKIQNFAIYDLVRIFE